MSSSSSAAERFVLALRRINRALIANNRAVGVALGIKDSDLAVLDVLHQEGPQTPTALARATRSPLATMTGVLGRLERDGWIERRPEGTDRRSVRIHAAGVDRLTALYAQTNAQLSELVGDRSEDDLDALAALLGDAAVIAGRLTAELDGEPSADPSDAGRPRPAGATRSRKS